MDRRPNVDIFLRRGTSQYHKSRPGSSGLQEAPKPIPGKTICDAPGSADCLNATDLLKSGFQRGMVSEKRRNNWPQNVWAVDGDGVVYEAQLSNKERGQYHGYPMKRGDSFADFIGDEWENRRT